LATDQIVAIDDDIHGEFRAYPAPDQNRSIPKWLSKSKKPGKY